MFNIKDLPPIEREPNGSLPRMTDKQRREAIRLIKGLCSYNDNGNCLYLDRDEEVICPQSVSYSVCCKFFRHVLLKHEEGKGLEAALFHKDALKRCVLCGKAFSSTSNNAKYCVVCGREAQKRQKAEYARKKRAERVEKLRLKTLDFIGLFSLENKKVI
ncbi:MULTISPECIES: cysteine-rich VLP protein [Anaerotruncus]|uniref:Cysteine-rich VLP protein n=1 Tax=Anaerotruncus massiliensis (ex Togo et al. 2019) TaxID=1673720 RepID=A0ABR7AFP7_9FIRM|nr:MULTISPECIES: cysteine-rich VLP protein [Anaerotruncus]MBC3939266.1 cysteine-rich VLP protein [Anaerotruncus massiliensis (ex Togo et al. 2019)]